MGCCPGRESFIKANLIFKVYLVEFLSFNKYFPSNFLGIICFKYLKIFLHRFLIIISGIVFHCARSLGSNWTGETHVCCGGGLFLPCRPRPSPPTAGSAELPPTCRPRLLPSQPLPHVHSSPRLPHVSKMKSVLLKGCVRPFIMT